MAGFQQDLLDELLKHQWTEMEKKLILDACEDLTQLFLAQTMGQDVEDEIAFAKASLANLGAAASATVGQATLATAQKLIRAAFGALWPTLA